MRIFLDANILYSAAASNGAIRKLVLTLGAAGHTCVADLYVWEEAKRNLAQRSASLVEELHNIRDSIEFQGSYAGGGVDMDSVSLHEKDVPVLASAIGLKCEALVTGDRTHFGHLFGETVLCVTVYSPLMLAKVTEIPLR